LYQKIASIPKIAELQNAFGDMKEAYGKPPQEVKNLYALLKLRIICQKTDISRIESKRTAQGDKLFITFSPSINPKMIPSLLDSNDAWTFSQDQIRIPFEKLGTDWFASLETIIKLAQRFRLDSDMKQSMVKTKPQE
jgi:transcription-repair coupling factor (superfamily II helicase)